MAHPVYTKVAASDHGYVTIADTGALVRATLTARFPGVKFYVRSKSYAGGGSIHVYYDGIADWPALDVCYCAGGPTLRGGDPWRCDVCGFTRRTPAYRPGAPTLDDVRAAVAPFAGHDFDGMVDLSFPVSAWLNPDGTATLGRSGGSGAAIPGYDFPRPDPGAVLVHFGAGYVFVDAELPYDIRAKGAA